MSASNLEDSGNAAPPRVVAVTGGKGGVGKTTVSINLAVGLAVLGHEVVLLDADLSLANIDVVLGLAPTRTLSDVLDGACTLDDIVLEGPCGIGIVPGGSGVQHMVEPAPAVRGGLINAFGRLERRADFMVVDTAAGITANTLDFCNASHEVLMVVCDDPASITDAYATIKLLRLRGGHGRFRVLVNMAYGAVQPLRLFARLLELCDQHLDVSLDFAGQIPFDTQVAWALRRRRCVLEASPFSAAGEAFKELAETTEKWPMPDGASGRLEFFVERIARVQALGGGSRA